MLAYVTPLPPLPFLPELEVSMSDLCSIFDLYDGIDWAHMKHFVTMTRRCFWRRGRWTLCSHWYCNHV